MSLKVKYVVAEGNKPGDKLGLRDKRDGKLYPFRIPEEASVGTIMMLEKLEGSNEWKVLSIETANSHDLDCEKAKAKADEQTRLENQRILGEEQQRIVNREIARKQIVEQMSTSWWASILPTCCIQPESKTMDVCGDATVQLITSLEDELKQVIFFEQEDVDPNAKALAEKETEKEKELEDRLREQRLARDREQAQQKNKQLRLSALKVEREAKQKAEADERRRILQERAAVVEREEREQIEEFEFMRLQRLGELGKPGAILQTFLLDKQKWVNTMQEEVKMICDHVAGGDTRWTMNVRNTLYIVEWDHGGKIEKKQIHAQNRKEYLFRIVFP